MAYQDTTALATATSSFGVAKILPLIMAITWQCLCYDVNLLSPERDHVRVGQQWHPTIDVAELEDCCCVAEDEVDGDDVAFPVELAGGVNTESVLVSLEAALLTSPPVTHAGSPGTSSASRFFCSINPSATQQGSPTSSGELLLEKATPESGAWLGALENCLLLSQLNTMYLNSTFATLNAVNKSAELAIEKADDVHTLLSAIVTTQETCHDGLQTASWLQERDALQQLVANESPFYRASLAMFPPKDPRKRELGRDLLQELKVRRDGLPHWVNDKKFFQVGSGSGVRSGEELFDVRGLLMHGKVVVAQNGSGNFRSINDAIAAAPEDLHPSDGYHVIKIKAGVYEENICIGSSKRNIMMVGDGIQKTIITGRRSVAGGASTYNSSTLIVLGENFVAIGITIRNTAGPAMGQAVAFLNGSDKSVLHQCSIEGYQDTLYVYSFRQFYRECNIFGTVNFIFGDAAAVFQLCNIYARVPLSGQENMVTAQGRVNPYKQTGIAIIHSNILATPKVEVAAARGEEQSYLGRPWKEYSRTVIMLSNIRGFINPAGWSAWSGDFALSTLYYGEYGNRGAGASTRNRVKWLEYHLMTIDDARNFTAGSFIDGSTWLPATKVPFSLGLL
ncbi:pectinesterase-like [Nymphaea colorata]|uniref:pectinesterase-like n=1 Tax=Nymphaea colorata TaxID=210225 RepID=UPI00129D8BB5|nr:pectinesterase-like [Nymphaea colorata]